ncbi:helix-turn-helix transcriptional regulator [Micromonospora sp. WMMD964]|uniref:helix-turn-helix domain-containing protein n=1 Tax=Micromonospora sp. WMMD964 TaxID=3016091 RepID=UPI00249AE71F|nr:helix-turn-helix transcriptional regulator [Micromonospora sp. WMMD964]WFF02533.1 helix-turn-helix transcriptional regulator [Micromonospora sp. WMMD964]
MPLSASQDPRVIAFARFIKRALDEAVRERAMSIEDVEQRTGIGRSTIYRWRRAEIANPQRTQVQQFCDGLGIPRAVAAQILGWDGAPPSPDPDPSTDPDLRAIARILMDPGVAEEEKTVIRATLQHLARRR